MIGRVLLLLYGLLCMVRGDLNVRITPEEYQKLTGQPLSDGMTLVGDRGSPDPLTVPSCHDEVTLEWYNDESKELYYSIGSIDVDPTLNDLVNVIWEVPSTGVIPNNPEAVRLKFNCSRIGDALITLPVVVSSEGIGNHSTTYELTLHKYCSDQLCQLPTSCDQVQCENGGYCIVFGLQARCQCPRGYEGSRCELAICNPKCEHGICIEADRCYCDKGYYGNRCQYATCRPACMNDGRCVKVGVCQCRVPFYGPRCEKRGRLSFRQSLRHFYSAHQANTVLLSCETISTHRTGIKWLKNGQPINKTDRHYYLDERYYQQALTPFDHVRSSNLFIFDVTRNDTAWYTCAASTKLNSVSSHGYLIIYPHLSHNDIFSGQWSCEGCDDTEQSGDQDG